MPKNVSMLGLIPVAASAPTILSSSQPLPRPISSVTITEDSSGLRFRTHHTIPPRAASSVRRPRHHSVGAAALPAPFLDGWRVRMDTGRWARRLTLSNAAAKLVLLLPASLGL